MPPISQQGSRAALVTWVVVLAILFVVATIFAFYFSAEARTQEKAVGDNKKKYNEYVLESTFNEPKVQDLKALRASEPATPGTTPPTVLDIAIQQRDDLAGTINGKPGSAPVTAKEDARAALARANDDVKALGLSVPSPTANLTGAITALSSAVVAKQNELQTAKAQLEEANKKVAETMKAMEEQLASKDKDIEAARADAKKALDDATADREAKQAQLDELEKQRGGESTKGQEALNKVQAQVAEKERAVADLQKKLEAIQRRLGLIRVNPNGPVLRQADGQIVRLPGNNICYINLGAGDQVSPGLTFEIYDKNEGVPALTQQAGEESLPEGKASIEVTRVGATSSECRIVHQKPGAHLTEGDLIANLVYDPNTKYTFDVYGNFDMDNNGVATAADADVIKRLVTQWGGKLTDKVNVDTDFIVLGKEPELPNFTKEELEDAINQKKLEDAKLELEAYQKVRGEASDLHIPILNQNRFLYFVGYYDQAKR